MNDTYTIYNQILQDCLQKASTTTPTKVKNVKTHLDIILKHSERSKGVLSVLITSLVKKAATPKQDIRYHQNKMKDGYSGRLLDTRIITPFLKNNQFPAMSESGWLTRSLEQSHPYDMNYPGSITPKELKSAFLNIIDMIQTKDTPPKKILVYLLRGLMKQRDTKHNLILAKPIHLPLHTIMSYLDKHFNTKYKTSGAARLPVLAVYAAYEQMIKEMSRYKKHSLRELRSHTAADTPMKATGDIEVFDENSKIFEAVEIKHQIKITPTMINNAYSKFKSKPTISRYYLLTTRKDFQNDTGITSIIINIQKRHGCQVIVNGVMDTLKYYLRLIKSPDDFVQRYITLVEKEQAIKFEHKQRWNDIVQDRNDD
jgi:DNA (cytosine-5)-methyltransferase 1